MAYLRSRNAVLLAKIEAAEGTPETPSASTDAILVEPPRVNFQPNILTTNEVTGSLDGFGDIVGGMWVELAFDLYIKGSGTASTAPEYDALLKACGLAATVTSTAVPASAEACGAGGTTTTAELGSSATGTAQLYRGMPITFTEEVTGDSFISNYTSGKIATLTDTFAAIDADTDYQIPVNVRYTPGSASIPSLTLEYYMDGLKYIFAGARGNAQFRIDAGGIGRISFTFRCMFISKTDASVPTPTYDATRPVPFKNGKMLIERSAAAVQSLTIDLGNVLTNPDNPNALEGFDPAQITGRKITGSFNPAETLVATRDIVADFRAGTRRLLHWRWGSTAGNRMAFTIPLALYTGPSPNDRSGLAVNDVSFQPIGQDAGFFLTFW